MHWVLANFANFAFLLKFLLIWNYHSFPLISAAWKSWELWYIVLKDNNGCLLRVIPLCLNAKSIKHNLLILLNVFESLNNRPCLFENDLTTPASLVEIRNRLFMTPIFTVLFNGKLRVSFVKNHISHPGKAC